MCLSFPAAIPGRCHEPQSIPVLLGTVIPWTRGAVGIISSHQTPAASHNQNLFSPHCLALLSFCLSSPSKPQLTSSMFQGCQDCRSGGIFSIFVSVTSAEECKGQNSRVGSAQGVLEKANSHPNVSCLPPHFLKIQHKAGNHGQR